jgi:hypothetical protein
MAKIVYEAVPGFEAHSAIRVITNSSDYCTSIGKRLLSETLTFKAVQAISAQCSPAGFAAPANAI